MSTDLAPALDLDALRDRIDTVLAQSLRRPPASVPSQRGRAGELTRALTDFVLAPGKRIRPLLCVLGWHAAGGDGDGEETLWRTAASLEVFHAFALIHDDLIDGSPTRRGRPSVHRDFAARHRSRPDADTFGTNAALLLGDLALACSNAFVNTAGLSARQRDTVLPLLDAMRGEVLLGQYMDLMATGRPTEDVEEALTIARLKTAKYTVERPLQLGAALAGADRDLLSLCSAYALPLGEAFQLRDDLLGVFGDPAVTGKPVFEDLRSGKPTVLMALATRRATPEQRGTLDALVGRADLGEDDAARVRHILQHTGARASVEDMITERYAQALRVLDDGPLAPRIAAALRQIAARVTVRAA
ncbi:polyprenyl synthetase family protein [Streptomyces sp. ISL-12]|uniref:polyprenyl synthetase family protein n=1 Tax=Streptomyces sp. ISL-12 TaxID=2819177 RepID=UPI001BEC5F59|nr:polyprenyl synthetase family protein [Streptomyces sp. ISL-12]MBT2411048.1 polyprenyl synthetase family protein [Streptomyces sp. ISL-12]